MKFKVAKEVAEAEFIRLCEAHRVDYDTSEFKEDELAKWTALKEGIVRDLQRGTLIVGEGGQATYTPPGSSSGLSFHPATGATMITIRSKTNEVEGMCLALAEMTRTDRGTFAKLHVQDFGACARLYQLFLESM